jgi:hypothetical protein
MGNRPERDSPDAVRPPRWNRTHGSGPALPHEPSKPITLQDAECWLAVYDEYVAKLVELGREYDIEGELQNWIERCARRRDYWARARERLQRQEDRERLLPPWPPRGRVPPSRG